MTSGNRLNQPETSPVNVPGNEANLLWNSAIPTEASTLGHTLVLAPHPDDESLGCGGTLALLRQSGYRVQVVFVSDGTQSHPHSGTYPALRLRNLREAEALAALQELGIGPDMATFLRLPDRQVPGVAAAGHTEAATKLASLIRAFGPTTLLVPYEKDPHPDHRATYQLLQTALNQMAAPWPRVLEYIIWLWELAQPADWPRPDQRKVLQVTIETVTDQKKRAIHAHQSQVSRLIDDDPTAFYLSPELLRHFDTPHELFLMKPTYL